MFNLWSLIEPDAGWLARPVLWGDVVVRRVPSLVVLYTYILQYLVVIKFIIPLINLAIFIYITLLPINLSYCIIKIHYYILVMIYVINSKRKIKYFRDFTQEFILFKKINNYNEINNNTKNKNNTNDSFSLNKKNKELGFYLAGLIEVDGSIIMPRSNSNNTPTISISFHEDDKPLAKKICEILGFGSIELILLSKAVKIQIRGKYSIINTLVLIKVNLELLK